MVEELQVRFESSARVEVTLQAAGIGNRALAYLVDLSLVGSAWLSVLFIATYVVDQGLAPLFDLGGLGQALALVAALLLTSSYDIFFELFWDGQTPGKRLLGLRVLRLDGGRVGVAETAVRNLLRVVDLLPMGYGVGVLCMALTRQQRRLGDLAAGCVVTRERRLSSALLDTVEDSGLAVDAALLARARGLELEPGELALLADFLRRREELIPAARERIACTLAESYAAELDGETSSPVDPGEAELLLQALLQAHVEEDRA